MKDRVSQIEIPSLDIKHSILRVFAEEGGMLRGKVSFKTSYPYGVSLSNKYHTMDWEDNKFKASRVQVLQNLNYLVKKGIKVEFVFEKESIKMLEDLKILQDYRLLNNEK